MAVIDVSDVTNAGDLHERIAAALGFPDYYGRNWDAFDECSTDPEIPTPREVQIRGLDALAMRLPREADLMRQCFSDREREGRFRVLWQD